MSGQSLLVKCESYLKQLCEEISNRAVGSDGNREATQFFKQEIASFGWKTESHEFEAMDWKENGAELTVSGNEFAVFPSPYSLGGKFEAKMVSVANLDELKRKDISGKIVLLHGEIAQEQLMPKNFIFYNPEKHKEIIALLEKTHPAALVCATGRNASLAGGAYPFPLIEDGDFDIPSVFMTEDEGTRLRRYCNQTATLHSKAKRIPGKGYNVIGRKGRNVEKRIVMTAHIDAKKGTPGAIDNATGVTVLLIVANMLAEYDSDTVIEIVALNGEDYFAVPGQMLYLSQNQDRFHEIKLNINIDGAGYKAGKSAFSFFNLPTEMENQVREVMDQFNGISEGQQWPQGDHSIFVQQGCPALAVTSQWFIENMDSQEITHTPKDNLSIVDARKVVEIAKAISKFVFRSV